MRGMKFCVALGLTAAVGAIPAGAMTLGEVIAKHVEARGGDRWDEIDSMKISGSYTAFSVTEPFTLEIKRGHRYLLDAFFVDSRRQVGFDGEQAWSNDEDGPEEIDGLDRAILYRESDFPNPFFSYEDDGYEVTLIEDAEFDGMKAIGLEVKRDDGHSETWYLDPATYLEMGRISPGSDWLGPVERRTYYDDYREVDGVMVPYYTESQWYTRNRVMEIDSIETNVEISDAVFRMPAPLGMGPLQPLVGTWSVSLSQRQTSDAEWQESERRSTIEAKMRGGLLEEYFKTDAGVEVLRTISFDRYNDTYRVTQIDNQRNQLNVQEGQLGEDGKLVVSNVETGTSWTTRGTTIHGRVSFYDVGDEGFKVEYETSTDGGENWFVSARAAYTRGEQE